MIPPFPTECVAYLKSLGWTVKYEPNSGYWNAHHAQPEDYIGRDNMGEILTHDIGEREAWSDMCYRAIDRGLWPIPRTETAP
jgi:hypothetical protein